MKDCDKRCLGCGRNTELIEGYCFTCSCDRYCAGCGGYGELQDTDEGGRCAVCFADYHYCMDCGNLIHSRRGYLNGDFICFDCCGLNYDVCEACGRIARAEEMVAVDDYYYCEPCIPNNGYPTRCCGGRLPATSFDEIESDCLYGIEIETASGEYCNVPASWGIHYDGSITGMEIVSPIMQGDAGLRELEKVYACDLTFDKSCGIHVHINVRDLTDVQKMDLIKAFLETKKAWFNFVDLDRQDNDYCLDCLPALRWGDYFNSYMDRTTTRYSWLNLDAYSKHGTFELRLLEGCHLGRLKTWLKMILKFVEEVKGMACV